MDRAGPRVPDLINRSRILQAALDPFELKKSIEVKLRIFLALLVRDLVSKQRMPFMPLAI
jgi:hypothetical protein